MSIPSSAADFDNIDFSDDLDAISRPSGQAGDTSQSLDDELSRLGSGNALTNIDADIKRWDQSVATEKSQQYQAKLNKVGERCDRFWKGSGSCSLIARFGITLDQRGLEPYQEAYKYCQQRYPVIKTRAQGQRFSRCKDNKEEKIIEQRRRNSRKAAREKRRREENYMSHCKAERAYCGTVKDDFDAGRLPTAAEPNWKPVDEETFRGMLDEIDADFQKQQDERAARRNANLERENKANAIEDAKTTARLQRKAAADRLSTIRKDKKDRWCAAELSAGRDWCSCPNPGIKRTTCAK